MSNNPDNSGNSSDWSTAVTCQACGNPMTSCTCAPENRVNRVVEIRHTGLKDPKAIEKEMEKLRNENEEFKNLIALEAMKSFEKDKEELVNQFPENRRTEISEHIGESVETLENVRTSLLLQSDNPRNSPVTKRAPSGKAPLPQINNDEPVKDGANPFRDYIANLYMTAKKSTNPVERDNAEKEIHKLFNEYEKSMFEHKSTEFKTTATQCLQCGVVLTGRDAELYASRKGKCSSCGYAGGIVPVPRHLEDT